MAFLDDIYLSEETVSADFQQKTSVTDPDTGITTESFASALVVDGLLWTGSMAEKYVSERYRPIIQGVFVMNYEDYTTTINADAKVTIGSKDYGVIYINNVANQNQVIEIPLKEYT